MLFATTTVPSAAARIGVPSRQRKNAPEKYNNDPDKLTPREQEVMHFLAVGMTRGEMSSILDISLHGIKKHITNIYGKLGATNRTEAIHIVTAFGFLDA